MTQCVSASQCVRRIDALRVFVGASVRQCVYMTHTPTHTHMRVRDAPENPSVRQRRNQATRATASHRIVTITATAGKPPSNSKGRPCRLRVDRAGAACEFHDERTKP